ncbi:MAG: hypothetical protein MT334_04845 [Candidatus Nitrosopumilus limneticus]|nr:hypothetical protein [Thermoproteota archaeon]MDC4212786.1 hypothetical protein [Candidatus Nitrosopumilus limneticus]HJJ21198.1 hypothetical protein [Nitrosopumilus sp.]MDA0854254.1 hypothetical protein [Thermoproteota archaeon]MDA1123161.1 hypothetical protein [Thermoproteota archaeon]
MKQSTKNIISEFSPMWTNKQVWEFEQINENLTFDMIYVKPGNYNEDLWKSKSAHLDSDVRDVIVRTFDNLLDKDELWISSKGIRTLDKKHIPYLMALIADTMIEEEVCLNLKLEKDCLVISIDRDADVIDCKEFFEEFYHLATGFNYDTDTGIPDDPTEAEMYLTRLQDEFDEKMKDLLGSKYLPGNNDPDTINAEE